VVLELQKTDTSVIVQRQNKKQFGELLSDMYGAFLALVASVAAAVVYTDRAYVRIDNERRKLRAKVNPLVEFVIESRLDSTPATVALRQCKEKDEKLWKKQERKQRKEAIEGIEVAWGALPVTTTQWRLKVNIGTPRQFASASLDKDLEYWGGINENVQSQSVFSDGFSFMLRDEDLVGSWVLSSSDSMLWLHLMFGCAELLGTLR